MSYKYLMNGQKIRTIGEVNGLVAGYTRVEYAWGDEVEEGDGEAVLLRPSLLHDSPPTKALNEEVARLQAVVEKLREQVGVQQRELAKAKQESNSLQRWVKQHQAWVDFEGLITGRLTHRAEFNQWGVWSITPLTDPGPYARPQDDIVLVVKKNKARRQWYWAAKKGRDHYQETQLFESEEAAKNWVETELLNVSVGERGGVDLRQAREIIKRAKEYGIRCPFHIVEFVEGEAEKERQEKLEQLRAQMEALATS